eukprot:184324-Chlamydomonas_euryale.AAC.7
MRWRCFRLQLRQWGLGCFFDTSPVVLVSHPVDATAWRVLAVPRRVQRDERRVGRREHLVRLELRRHGRRACLWAVRV